MKNIILGIVALVSTLSATVGHADIICDRLTNIYWDYNQYQQLKSVEGKRTVTSRIQYNLYKVNYALRASSASRLKEILLLPCVHAMPAEELNNASDLRVSKVEARAETVLNIELALAVGGVAIVAAEVMGPATLVAPIGSGSFAAAAFGVFTVPIAEYVVGMSDVERREIDVQSRIAARKQTRILLSTGLLPK